MRLHAKPLQESGGDRCECSARVHERVKAFAVSRWPYQCDGVKEGSHNDLIVALAHSHTKAHAVMLNEVKHLRPESRPFASLRVTNMRPYLLV